jgi:hypothetical protein
MFFILCSDHQKTHTRPWKPRQISNTNLVAPMHLESSPLCSIKLVKPSASNFLSPLLFIFEKSIRKSYVCSVLSPTYLKAIRYRSMAIPYRWFSQSSVCYARPSERKFLLLSCLRPAPRISMYMDNDLTCEAWSSWSLCFFSLFFSLMGYKYLPPGLFHLSPLHDNSKIP